MPMVSTKTHPCELCDNVQAPQSSGARRQVVGLIEKDLSEPYSIFTYRYFINNWPKLCIMVRPSPCYSSLPSPVAKTPARDPQRLLPAAGHV